MKLKNKTADEIAMGSGLIGFLLLAFELIFEVPFSIDIPVLVDIIKTKNFIALAPFVPGLYVVIQRVASKLISTGFSWSNVWRRISASQNFWVKGLTSFIGIFSMYGFIFPDTATEQVSDALSSGDYVRAITVLVITVVNYNIIKKVG